MTDAIVLENVTKTFGEKVAVRDLDLVIPPGSLTGLIGPNGAGKTTSIRIVMSILFADRGRVSVLGHPSALEAKDRIGYLPEERGVYKKMKVGSFLTYMAKLKDADGPDLRKRVRKWLERVELADVENKRCEELSKGMQQKVQFIATVIHEPDLLILDEPFSGLDPINMRLLRDLFLEQHQRGATIIFSTHVMHQAEQICERVVMINEGNKVLDDSLTDIRTKYDPREILLEPLDAASDPAPLRELPFVEGIGTDRNTWHVTLSGTTDPAEAMREIVARIAPARIELHRPTLEDVFVQIVSEAKGARAEQTEQLRASVRADPHAVAEEA